MCPRLFVRSASGGGAFADGINRHFTGFEAGFSQFREAYPTLQHRIVRAAGACAVHDAPLHDPAQRRRLDIYQEVFRPLAAERQMALSAPLPQGEAMLIAAFAQTEVPSFNGQRHQMLNLLVPAFEAGLRFRQHLTRARRQLRTVLDQHHVALVAFDADGAEVHRNRAFVRLLPDADDAEAVLRAARSLVRTLQQASSDELPTASQAVRCAAGRYALRACYDATVAGDGGVLVTVERTSVLPSQRQVERRFALTQREAEVALLMAEGYTDQEISERLFISVHTARCHTARVLTKLGLSSRAGVALTLLQEKKDEGA